MDKNTFLSLAQDAMRQDGCYEWTGTRNPAGYGKVQYQNRQEYVHRLVAHLLWEFDLRSDLLVCHRCDNPKCFNAKHLFIGTDRDNTQDAISKGRLTGKKKSHCAKGHEFTAATTRWDTPNRRRCRICQNEYQRNWRLAKLG